MSRKRRSKFAAQSKRSQSTTRRAKKKGRQQKRSCKRQTNCQSFNKAMNWFFGTEDIFGQFQFHGNIKWAATNLAKIALLFSWSEKRFVTDAFDEAARWSRKIGIDNIHSTYQGFMGALWGYVHIFIPVLLVRLHGLMQQSGGSFWEIAGFVPIAFDGSRNTAPRTVSNEDGLCSPKNRKKINCPKRKTTLAAPKPQAWITLMWHMGLRLPWDWRLGRSDSSERGHALEMVEMGQFPKNTLFCGDAGFVGYDFWGAIIGRGYDFVVRIGGNVNLLSETMDYETVSDTEVLCWPKDKQRKHPPQRLRLVQVAIGKADIYLLTSVLSSKRLPSEELAELYKMRWGIEVEFRGLKQTLNGSKLRCRNIDRLFCELHWSLLSMTIAELFATKEQISATEATEAYSPMKRSLANTMRAIWDCLDALDDLPADGSGLFQRFELAMTDNYQRNASKTARYRPPNKDKKKLGKPNVRKINKHERDNMNEKLLMLGS